MGIPGLLKCLRSITKKVHIKEYQGLRVGIDIHCWLHRGSYACGRDLAEGNATDKYITFCMDMLLMIKTYGIIPVVIFDGRPLPAKYITNKVRRENREKNKLLGERALNDGDELLANKMFQKSINITFAMVYELIKALKKENIRFIIAPYESDAQLAFLCIKKYVDVVITEDSDLIVYGCRRVLFKLDKDGYGEELVRKNLGANAELSFLHWTDEQFKLFCCLAGCDYLEKLSGVGIKTAYKYVSKYKTLDSVLAALQHARLIDNTMEYAIAVSFITLYSNQSVLFESYLT